MDPNTHITWKTRPVFSLVNDEYYRTLVCTAAGEVELGVGGCMLSFPVGWRTDIASVPWFLQSLLSQIGAHAPAALLHDRMLDMGFPRDVARKWMHTQLKQSPRVTRCRRWLMLAGVWCYDCWCAVTTPQQ
jgi:hypothetical protein